MSGRFQTHTVASEGAELDENYQKMVADIEEQTQRSGWLFGRGAFDKADLQYLRDFNNSLRYKEVEIEDKEKALWERERARVEAEAAAAAAAAAQQAAMLTRRSSSGSAPGTALLRGPSGGTSRPAPLLLPVKVKPAGSKATPRQPTSPTAPPGDEPSCKRARTDSAAAAGGTADAHASPLSTTAALAAAGVLRSVKSEPSPAAPSLRATLSAGPEVSLGTTRPPTQHRPDQHPEQSQEQHRKQQTRSQPAAEVHGDDAAGPKGGAAVGGNSRPTGQGAAAPAGGLANLLGGYGSEDDDEVGGGEDGGCAHASGAGGELSGGGSDKNGMAPKPPSPVGLLSPEELLADPRVISEGLLATRPQSQAVEGGDAWNSDEQSELDSEA